MLIVPFTNVHASVARRASDCKGPRIEGTKIIIRILTLNMITKQLDCFVVVGQHTFESHLTLIVAVPVNLINSSFSRFPYTFIIRTEQRRFAKELLYQIDVTKFLNAPQMGSWTLLNTLHRLNFKLKTK